MQCHFLIPGNPSPTEKKDNLLSYLLIPAVEEHCLGPWEITQRLQKWPWGFPISKTFFSSCRLGVLQGVFQSQRMVWDPHWVPSVGTQCGCQVKVIRPFSDSETIFLVFQVKCFCLLSTLSLAHHMLPTAEASRFAVFQVVILRYSFKV